MERVRVELPSGQSQPAANLKESFNFSQCLRCPVNEACCNTPVLKNVSPPFLTDSDVLAISRLTGLSVDQFSEVVEHPQNGHKVRIMKTITISDGQSTCFFFTGDRKCSIYKSRPYDCRLFPLDILKKGGKYYWILYTICKVDQQDPEIGRLVRIAESFLLPEIRPYIDDYATFEIGHSPAGQWIEIGQINI